MLERYTRPSGMMRAERCELTWIVGMDLHGLVLQLCNLRNDRPGAVQLSRARYGRHRGLPAGPALRGHRPQPGRSGYVLAGGSSNATIMSLMTSCRASGALSPSRSSTVAAQLLVCGSRCATNSGAHGRPADVDCRRRSEPERCAANGHGTYQRLMLTRFATLARRP